MSQGFEDGVMIQISELRKRLAELETKVAAIDGKLTFHQPPYYLCSVPTYPVCPHHPNLPFPPVWKLSYGPNTYGSTTVDK
jgi:hypothetical protein